MSVVQTLHGPGEVLPCLQGWVPRQRSWQPLPALCSPLWMCVGQRSGASWCVVSSFVGSVASYWCKPSHGCVRFTSAGTTGVRVVWETGGHHRTRPQPLPANPRPGRSRIAVSREAGSRHRSHVRWRPGYTSGRPDRYDCPPRCRIARVGGVRSPRDSHAAAG